MFQALDDRFMIYIIVFLSSQFKKFMKFIHIVECQSFLKNFFNLKFVESLSNNFRFILRIFAQKFTPAKHAKTFGKFVFVSFDHPPTLLKFTASLGPPDTTT